MSTTTATKMDTKGKTDPRGSQDNTSKEIYFTVETITPDMAAQYLETSPKRKAIIEGKRFKKGEPEIAGNLYTVQSYAEIMKSNAWVVNAMPIIFNRRGELIDGIQRLEACVLSGEPIKTFVAHNVRSDTLHTIDQHRKRSYTGVLESRGIHHAGALQRTMTMLIRIENGLLGKSAAKISWSRFDNVLENNPDLIEAVSIAEGSRQSLLHATPRPVISYMALAAGQREKLRFFHAGLSDIDTFPVGNPVRMLAGQLRSEARRVKAAKEDGKNYEGFDTQTTLGMAILAFNDYTSSRNSVDEYDWRPDYGKAKRYRDNKAKVMELAPPNLGLPLINDYPGLVNGRFDIKEPEEFSGELAETLIQANKQSSGEEEIVMRTVTPEIATRYLRLNRDNRKLSDKHRKAIADDIKSGNWMLNAQPICFTGDPDAPDAYEKGVRLLNGQHRLHGCIEADTPIDVPIAKNIAAAAFATYDTQTKKIRRETEQNAADERVMNAAARIQWKEDNGVEIYSTGISPTASGIIDTINNHPGLADGYARARAMKHVGSAGIMLYLIYHVRNDHSGYAEDFLNDLSTGENLGPKNPVIGARTAIIGHRDPNLKEKVRNKISIPRKEILRTLITSWRDYKTYRDELAEDSAQGSLLD